MRASAAPATCAHAYARAPCRTRATPAPRSRREQALAPQLEARRAAAERAAATGQPLQQLYAAESGSRYPAQLPDALRPRPTAAAVGQQAQGGLPPPPRVYDNFSRLQPATPGATVGAGAGFGGLTPRSPDARGLEGGALGGAADGLGAQAAGLGAGSLSVARVLERFGGVVGQLEALVGQLCAGAASPAALGALGNPPSLAALPAEHEIGQLLRAMPQLVRCAR